MYQLVEWFQVNYPEIRNDLIHCNHNFDEKNLNPYHLESDCWSHTMMVCKIAELSNYDKVVQVAALLHDIGKPASRKINSKNNYVQFFGHEELSAKMAVSILDHMMCDNIVNIEEKEEIIQLITHHAFLHKHKETPALFEYFKGDKEFCIHLVQMSRCDSFGRFCSDLPNEEKYQQLFREIEIFYMRNYKASNFNCAHTVPQV